ncbi:MAG: hypothetical protein AB1861_20265, partial [Cyanobacteriota bacterium]
ADKLLAWRLTQINGIRFNLLHNMVCEETNSETNSSHLRCKLYKANQVQMTSFFSNRLQEM